MVGVVAGGVVAWTRSGGDSDAAVRPPDPATAAQTSFPGLVAASGEPQLAGLRRAHPAAGEVATVDGPFDDRFSWVGLRLGPRAASGAIHVTSDVSDLLELQVVAGFYDRSGHLLGTARFVHHLDEENAPIGVPSERLAFRVAIPERWRAQVRSAAVGVPVLVNE